MQVNTLSKKVFLQLVHDHRDEFMRRIHVPEIFVVKQFYAGSEVLAFRDAAYDLTRASEPSWHPLKNGCPDYHRIHDNYPQAYVKQKTHAVYYHGFYPHNAPVFNFFREIFQLKNFLARREPNTYLANAPADGIIARVNVHNYPCGGGYQAEHIDPAGQHALVQTIVQGSLIGKDFSEGGLFARVSEQAPKFFIDGFTEPGDLIVLSPGIYHGVDPIDPAKDISWEQNSGRWIVMPIFVWSDYDHPENIKPVEVKSQTGSSSSEAL